MNVGISAGDANAARLLPTLADCLLTVATVRLLHPPPHNLISSPLQIKPDTHARLT